MNGNISCWRVFWEDSATKAAAVNALPVTYFVCGKSKQTHFQVDSLHCSSVSLCVFSCECARMHWRSFALPLFFPLFLFSFVLALLLPPGRSFWPSFSQLNSAADAFHVTRTRTRTGAGPTPSEIHELAYNQTHTHTYSYAACCT